MVFSKVEYYIIVFDMDVYFLCEIFYYFFCGNGLVFFNILIYVVVEGNFFLKDMDIFLIKILLCCYVV